MIGHNPGIESAALVLAGRGDQALLGRLRDKMPTGALATLELDGEWTDAATGTAGLVSFVVPRARVTEEDAMSDDVAAGDRDARPASPAMPALGPALDAARAQVVARGLTVNAFGQLTPLVTSLGLSLEALGPVKQLQKHFFSDAPWTWDDDEALADAIGPGVDRVVRHELEPGLTLVWGWEDGRFRLRVVSDAPIARPSPRGHHGRRAGPTVRGCRGPGGDAQPAHDSLRDSSDPRRARPRLRRGHRGRRPAGCSDLPCLRRCDRRARRTRFRGGDDLAARPLGVTARSDAARGLRGVHQRTWRRASSPRAAGHGLGP